MTTASGNTGILEQENGRVAQTVKAQVDSCAFAPSSNAYAPVRCVQSQSSNNKQLAEQIGERSYSSILRRDDLKGA